MIPREAITGDVVTNVLWSLVLSVVCVGMALVTGLWLARRIARPLQELSAEAEAVGRLAFEPRPFTRSPVREVRQLQRAVGEMKASLRSFRKYVPADLVHDLIATGAEARLGGREAVLTIFFSDVVNFTGLAERLEPQALVEHAGEYLSAVSEVIHQHRGTVDKFIGDGVMAFWGAPLENPVHAADACRAAWDCQRRLDGLDEVWKAAGKPALRTRIGVHTGPVIVGNLGSESRMNYTLIGDAVNLASRIEGLNRHFGTRILLSETTVHAAGPAMITRPVSRVLVKGRSRGVLVHELLAPADQAAPGLCELAAATTAAFAAFEERRFDEARARYRTILNRHPEDPVARTQMARCVELQQRSADPETDTRFQPGTK